MTEIHNEQTEIQNINEVSQKEAPINNLNVNQKNSSNTPTEQKVETQNGGVVPVEKSEED